MRIGAWSGLLRTRCRRPGCLLVAIFVLGMLSPLRGAAGPSRDVRAFSVLSWVRTDPLHPRLLYAGGYGYRASYPGIQGGVCLLQTARSLDGGTTWQDLARSLPRSYSAPYALDGSSDGGCGAAQPFTLSPDGTDVFYTEAYPCVSPDSCNLAGYGLYHSGDAGLHWGQPLNRPELDLHLDTGTFPQGFAFSPLDPRIVVVVLASEHNGPLVVRSGDGGSTWRYTLSDPMATADGTTIQNLLPGAVRMALDPTRARVVYLGEASTMDAAGLWLRSTDGGHTWHLLVFPVKLPQDGVTLGADPRLPGLLVARQIDPAIPPDRRYVSADHGGTWRAVACPGDLRGECPSTVLDNVFGAGKAYGFYADGVHAFTGGGAAGPRLALSAHLPCATKDRLYVSGGRTAGDPAYLLCRAPLAAAEVAALPAGSETTQLGALPECRRREELAAARPGVGMAHWELTAVSRGALQRRPGGGRLDPERLAQEGGTAAGAAEHASCRADGRPAAQRQSPARPALGRARPSGARCHPCAGPRYGPGVRPSWSQIGGGGRRTEAPVRGYPAGPAVRLPALKYGASKRGSHVDPCTSSVRERHGPRWCPSIRRRGAGVGRSAPGVGHCRGRVAHPARHARHAGGRCPSRGSRPAAPPRRPRHRARGRRTCRR